MRFSFFFILFILFSGPAQAIVSNGLVSYWSLDSNSISGNSITDLTGNGNTGTRHNNPGAINARIGGGESFNGTSQDITTANNAGLTNTTAFSVALWFRLTATTNNKVFITTGQDSNPFDGVWVAYGDGSGFCNNKLELVITQTTANNTERICSNSTFMTTATWTHLSMTYDGSQTTAGMKIYLNGALLATTVSQNQGFGAFTNRTWEIASSHTPDLFLDGDLDDIRIYNRALSAAEVRQLYEWGPEQAGD
jgi:hypothetical protein